MFNTMFHYVSKYTVIYDCCQTVLDKCDILTTFLAKYQKGSKMTWTTGTINTPDSWNSIAYGAGVFVTVANVSSNSSYSTDGITWNQGVTEYASPSRFLTSIMPVKAYWQSITYGNGKFSAVATNAYHAFSIDGKNWSFSTMPNNKNWQSVAYGNNYFVAVGSGFTTKMGYPYGSRVVGFTPDPHDWANSIMDVGLPWTEVVCGNHGFVAITSNSNASSTSTHGASWVTTYHMPANQNWTGLTYGGNKYVAVAANSNVAAYSTDGVNWTATTLPSASQWTSVAYGNGTFISVAYNGANAAVSSDGITWHSETMPATQPWTAITYGGNRFVAVASNTRVTAVRV